MLELLFLLLPVAAAYGWYMGRRSAQQAKDKEANRLSRDYVAGVNFLLSNQQDKAVDLFLEMLKEDTGTVEAHLTLGNLFRSRGEVDRAIRIHQTLMESASLTYDQRLHGGGSLRSRRRYVQPAGGRNRFSQQRAFATVANLSGDQRLAESH